MRQEKNALEEKKIRASKKQKNGKRPLEVEKRRRSNAFLFLSFESRGTGSLLVHAGLTDTGYFLFQTQRAGATCFSWGGRGEDVER